MTNLTVAIPEVLSRRMKRHSEVKWSEVVRKALTDYVDRLEIVECGVISAEALAKKLKEKGVDISAIDLDRAIKHYEEGRKQARKRLSTIQANL